MNTELQTPDTNEVVSQNVVAYEAPRIEEVLTSETLEREVAYAGVNPSVIILN